jgi:hypothetical protein
MPTHWTATVAAITTLAQPTLRDKTVFLSTCFHATRPAKPKASTQQSLAKLPCHCVVQAEVQAAYAALQAADERAASLNAQLEAAPIEAAAAANEKASVLPHRGDAACNWSRPTSCQAHDTMCTAQPWSYNAI